VLKKTVFKRVLLVLTVTIICLVALDQFGQQVLLSRNNADAEYPSQSDYRESYERSVQWLISNQDNLGDDNIWLSWMVQEAIRLTGDERAVPIVQKGVHRLQSEQNPKALSFLFFPEYYDPATQEDKLQAALKFSLNYYWINFRKHYEQMALYGVTGDTRMLPLGSIPEQFDIGFCELGKELIENKACTTHHLLGLMFVERNGNCPEGIDCKTLIAELQDHIVGQLETRPLVEDVYLQRVLMLLLTGAEERVKPVWLRRVLDYQFKDNGWMNYHLLWQLSDGMCIGLGSHGRSDRIPSLVRCRSNFHTTAQGMLISAYMLNEESG